MAGKLLEREAELAALQAALDGARTGTGSLVVVQGTAGLGKTSLLAQAERRAAGAGTLPLRARGTPLEGAIPFGVARQLFERAVAAAERGRLLAGPAAPAASALGTAALRPGAFDEELEVLHGLYWLTANLAEERPLALLIDDLHWADVPSLRFLAYLAQRLDDLPVTVVAATRMGEPGAPSELLTELAASSSRHLLRLDPLSPVAVAAFVRERHPTADDTFCRACAEATAGNPFLLGDLLDAVAAEGLAPVAATAERLGELDASTLAWRTLTRLERLGRAPAALARAVAVLGDDAELRHAAALAGLALEDAVTAAGALARAGLLHPGEPLAFVHPLLEAAIRDALSAAELADAHRAAADRLSAEGAATDRVAAHLLGATRAGAPAAVRTLEAAADEALGSGAAEAAVRFLRRALEEPPAPHVRPRLMVKLGEGEAALGHAGALDRMHAALDLLSDQQERALTLHRIGWTLYRQGDLRAAGEAFKRAVDEYEGAEDDELAAELRTAWIGVGALTGMVDPASLSDSPLAADARAPARTPAEREALTQLAVAELVACGSHARAADLARRALGDGAMLGRGGVTLSFSIAVSVLMWADALEEAERELEAGVEYAVARQAPVTAAYVRFGRSWPRYWRGQIDDALADLQEASDIWGGMNLTLPTCSYWLTRCHIEHGDLDAAAAVTVPPEHLEVTDPEVAMWGCGRAMLSLARGDAEAAWQELEKITTSDPVPFIHNPSVLPWRSTAALTLHALERREEALRWASEEVELARAFGASRPLGTALRAQGLVEGGERGIELLNESVRVLEHSPSTIEHARSLVDLGVLLRRVRRPRAAREPLRAALDALHGTTALALRERAQEELVAAGGRPRREALRGPESLTPSERRVADLAAAGRSNPEIARELFISRKTVEFHLGAVYRKLGISSREELGDALGAAA